MPRDLVTFAVGALLSFLIFGFILTLSVKTILKKREPSQLARIGLFGSAALAAMAVLPYIFFMFGSDIPNFDTVQYSLILLFGAAFIFCVYTDKDTRRTILTLRSLAGWYIWLVVAGFILYALITSAWEYHEKIATITLGALYLPVYLLGTTASFFSTIHGLLLIIALLLYGIYHRMKIR